LLTYLLKDGERLFVKGKFIKAIVGILRLKTDGSK